MPINPVSPNSGQYFNFKEFGLGPGISSQFLDQLKAGVLDFNSFSSSIFESQGNLKDLIDALEGNRVVVNVKGVLMNFEIKESSIVEGSEVKTQIKDPTYQGELLKHKDVKHYSILLRDPNRLPPAELQVAREELETFTKIMEKLMDMDDLNPDEQKIYDKAVEEWGDFGEAVMMKPMVIESLETEFAKPTISIRVSENNEIGEVASISIHSDKLNGGDLMKAVDQIGQALGIKHMYLEDDAKIESPHGSYNLRLFRYFTNKSSWYEDAFHFKAYSKNALEVVEEMFEPSKNIHSQAIHQLGSLTIAQVKNLLSNTLVDPSKSKPLLEFLNDIDESKTISELVKELGDAIIVKKEPLHKQLDLVLTNLLHSLASYSGNNPENLNFKKSAGELIDARFFSKAYVQ